MHNVSGYMIILNEEILIKDSLSCILPFVDDLVIMDTGSTDKTLEIIQEFISKNPKIRLFQDNQTGERYGDGWNQPEKRNQCLSLCKYNWVFTLDGDELFNGPVNLFRQNVKPMVFPRFNLMNQYVYITEVANIKTKEKLYWYPDPQIRFFNKQVCVYENIPRHCTPIKKIEKTTIYPECTHSEYHIWHCHTLVRSPRIVLNNFDIKTSPVPINQFSILKKTNLKWKFGEGVE